MKKTSVFFKVFFVAQKENKNKRTFSEKCPFLLQINFLFHDISVHYIRTDSGLLPTLDHHKQSAVISYGCNT